VVRLVGAEKTLAKVCMLPPYGAMMVKWFPTTRYRKKQKCSLGSRPNIDSAIRYMRKLLAYVLSENGICR